MEKGTPVLCARTGLVGEIRSTGVVACFSIVRYFGPAQIPTPGGRTDFVRLCRGDAVDVFERNIDLLVVEGPLPAGAISTDVFGGFY